MPYQFSELVAIHEAQPMLGSFFAATGIMVEILDADRRTILASARQGGQYEFLQNRSHFTRWMSQSEKNSFAPPDEKFSSCYAGPDGLTYYAAAIHSDSQPIAALVLGPVFHQQPDEAAYLRLARIAESEEAAVLDAVKQIPVLPEAQVQAFLTFLIQSFERLAEKGLRELHCRESIAIWRNREEKLEQAYQELEARIQDRTEKLERANDALQEGEQRFRIALINTPVVVFNQDVDLRYTWVYNLQNYSPQSVVGKTDADIFSPGDARRLIELKKRVMEAGVLTREEVSVTLGGRTLHFDMTLDPLFNPDGVITGLTCAATDITERKQIEDALRQTNEGLLQTQKRIEQILYALQAASSSLELESVLENILKVMIAAVEVDACSIYLIEREGGKLVSKAVKSRPITFYDQGEDGETFVLKGDSIHARIFTSGEPLVCSDAELETGLDQRTVQSSGIKSVLAVPLKVAERVLGVSILYTTRSHREFDQEEVELAQGIANSVALAVENARLYEEMRRRLVEREGLQRIARGLLQKIGLDEVLEIVCAEAMELTGAKGSAVFLHEEDGWLRLTHAAGTPEITLNLLPVQGSFAGRAVQTGNHVWVNLLENDPDQAALQVQGYPWLPGLRSLLAVPLKVDMKVIGVLDLLNKPGEITQEDVRILDLFADQAAIIIEHVRLQRQAEQLAVLEERQRLARELHDSVTQALYSVTLYADAARMAFSAKNWEALERNLHEVRNMAREAMFDMRLLVFELRPFMLEKEGLASALRARLAAVEGRAGLKTEVLVEGERRLPITVEEEIYRIAQEGLNNVVKHASAKNVQILLKYTRESVYLEMVDDGAGFDPETAGRSGGVGLRGIRERVKRLDGSLEVESRVGEGTRLRVTIPLSSGEYDRR